MEDKINNLLIPFNAVLGIANIESLLGIILLSFQILLLIIKFIKKIYFNIKNKKFNNIVDDTQNLVNDINNLIDKEVKKDER